MSQIEDHIAALAHMDGALAAMRVAAESIRSANEETADKVAQLWGNGNELAGRIAEQLLAAGEHVEKMDKFLMGAQVEAVHAMLILNRAAGKT